jgi:NAD(P)-dependent dehydrogenase (short-subunit alcohol dehydrogenase family)
MMKKLHDDVGPDDPAAVRTMVEGMVPMARYGTNDEIANLATFLASDESSYCTGSLFNADGGFLAV